MKLIDDIIDISKIEVGQIQIQKTEFEVNTLLDELFISSSDIIKEKGIDFKINNENPEHQFILLTDEFRLRQIFSNLINNALKFTDKGYIEIGYIIQKNDFVEFYVKDSGIGISDKNKQIIINVRSPRKFVKCPYCLKSTKRVHQTNSRLIKHSILDFSIVVLNLTVRRFKCSH